MVWKTEDYRACKGRLLRHKMERYICIYVYVCICIYIYVCIYIFIYTYICIYIGESTSWHLLTKTKERWYQSSIWYLERKAAENSLTCSNDWGIYIYIHLCIHIYIYTYTQTCVYICIYTYVYIYKYVRLYIYIYTPIYIHTYIYIYICIYIYTYM
jgi:hypothetical protein